jgi:hypothetical protein
MVYERLYYDPRRTAQRQLSGPGAADDRDGRAAFQKFF